MNQISAKKQCNCDSVTSVMSVDRPTLVSPVTSKCDIPLGGGFMFSSLRDFDLHRWIFNITLFIVTYNPGF
jgi:hypothetical protein